MKTICQTLLLLSLLLSGVFVSAQVPVMSSFPASGNVVFLDFDGHIVEGTSWNGNGPIVCDPATLNAAQITSIFNRVAEDYRPFTVNITTDSNVYWSAPANHRMRVVLTVSSSWYGSAGGVAFLNSFTWGDNTPCFVFTALLNNNTKSIAEATSHEIGHTLGLRHQSSYDAVCNKTAEYNPGRGTGEIGWAPIMGVGYYQNMTLWNYGANPYGCNAIQDDLSIITGNDNGISFRADDHGATTSTATTATVVNNAFALSGIIEQPGDVDAVKFSTSAAGRVTVDALPYAIAAGNTGSNLDLELELLDGSGTLLGVYNNPNALNAFIDTALPAGAYYLRVQGKGNAYAPNYAVLGSYELKAALPAGNNPLPVHKLQLKGVVENKQHKLTWEVVADEKIVRQTLEMAAGSEGFKTLAASAAPTAAYSYAPVSGGIVYYRLRVLFDNGREYYSNTVALQSNAPKGRPTLVSNLTNGMLSVSSPAVFAYTILDAAGRTLSKGTVTQGINSLHTSLQAGGVYLILFDNGKEHYAEKFSKQ